MTTAVDEDYQIAKAALLVSKRKILVKLFGQLVVEENPERRQAITETISRVLRERYT